jgi:hypothetical protein
MALQIAFVSASAADKLRSEMSSIRDLLVASTFASKLSFVRLVLHTVRYGREQEASSLQTHFELLSMVYDSISPSDKTSYKELVFDIQGLINTPLAGSTGAYSTLCPCSVAHPYV